MLLALVMVHMQWRLVAWTTLGGTKLLLWAEGFAKFRSEGGLRVSGLRAKVGRMGCLVPAALLPCGVKLAITSLDALVGSRCSAQKRWRYVDAIDVAFEC